MGILLFLIGLLAAGSGAVKLRGRSRQFAHWTLATGEVAVGALVVLGSGVGLARLRPLAWTAVATAVAVMAMSSAVHLSRVLGARRRRAGSEGERLQRQVDPRAR